MTETKRNGKIITFYSYKGGTGRSMVLANAAWILASQGKQVLVLDWDLEAPGLHRYFYPFLPDKDLTSSEGIIDFVHKFTSAATISASQKEQEEAAAAEPFGHGEEGAGAGGKADDGEWYKPYSNILRYAASLKWNFNDNGTIDFIPAGRQGPSYPTRVNSFDWDHFYNKLGGGRFLELAKQRMRDEYDYILIDSRTGVSDTAGVCTIQMPDILVICFTLNNQSIEGASNVAHDVFEKRLDAAKARAGAGPGGQPNPEEAIQIFPVPMRTENAEKVKLQTRKNYARDKFKLFPNSLAAEKRDRYWGNVPVTYIPFYAYEEILAVFGDDPADRVSVLAATEQLCSYLTGGTVTQLAPPTEAERKRVLEAFQGGLPKGDPATEENQFAESVFERLGEEEQELARRLLTRLVRAAQPEEVGGDTLLRVNVGDIEQPALKVLRPLLNASLVQKQTEEDGQEFIKIAQESLVKNWLRLRGWIDEDREFLLWRQRLQLKIAEWRQAGRDREALLSGTPLEEARRWLDGRGKDLNKAEDTYISWSEAEAERLRKMEGAARQRLEEERRLREQEIERRSLEVERLRKELSIAQVKVDAELRAKRLRRLVGAASTMILLTMTAIAFVAYRYFGGSDEAKNKSLQLAAFSTVAQDPELSVLLAIEAVRTEETVQADDALRRSLQELRQTAVLRSHTDQVFSATFSSDGKLILTAGADGKAVLWEQKDGAWVPSRQFSSPDPAGVKFAVFTPDNQFIATTDFETKARVFETATGKELASLQPKDRRTLEGFVTRPKPRSVAFNPDGRYLAVGAAGDADIWDWKASQTLMSVGEHTEDINSAVFSPDGRYIVTASSDRTAKVWDAASGKLIKSLPHSGEVYNARFSPDGLLIVTASQDGTARVWAANGDAATTYRHNGAVRDAAFSPDAKSIVTADADGTALVWSLGTGQISFTLRGHLTSVFSAQFSPDGKYVLTSSGDKTARVWDVSGDFSVGKPVDELISQGCKRLSRNMTQEEWQRYMSTEAYRKTCENLP